MNVFHGASTVWLSRKVKYDPDTMREGIAAVRYDSQQELLKLLERLYLEKVGQKTES